VASISRRAALRISLGVLLTGCSTGSRRGYDEASGVLPFVNEDDLPLDQLVGDGLDGRLYTDLSTLTPDTLVVPNDRFYVRTRHPDLLVPPARWSIRAGGLVEAPGELFLDELAALERPMGVHVLECSGNARGGHFGLLSAAEWGGIPIADVLARVGAPAAASILVSGFDEHSQPSAGGHSTPGASWIFRAGELEDAGAFLATSMNGEPLPGDHGAPVRLFVPGWYGCTCIKWVDAIDAVADEAPPTSQMTEFASRTEQDGTPALARDFAPAVVDAAALPIRVERVRGDGGALYRIVGVVWGGAALARSVAVSFGDGPFVPAARWSPEDGGAAGGFALWTAEVTTSRAGVHAIRCRIDDPGVRTRRLDRDYYLREVVV
jgi:DMSO/TMAO reductase YedYZ molybdopterin-dependent catalytic subunit